MIRLIGILIGSAFAVGFLILTLGLPTFEAPAGDRVYQAPPDDRVSPAPSDDRVSPAPSDEAVPETDSEVSVNASPPEPVLAEPKPEAEVAVNAVAEKQPGAPRESSSDRPNLPSNTVDLSEPAEQRWYAFWSPFRSEFAADGFVSQLQRTTGLDYRVVKLKPGVYEVAFAYADDEEIRTKLTQISTATGLDLTGG